jgi:5'-deoxynucleotidase YfbR-like HD superfamily hydrolase
LVANSEGERGEKESENLKWRSPLTANKVDDLWNIESDDVYAADIVHGLRQNRFSYHTHVPLNLLNHSVAVSDYLEERGEDEYTQLVGLLHDAHEAYTGDTVRPIKILYPEIDELEMSIQETIWDSFGIEEPSEETWSEIVDEADQAVLFLEADKTMSDHELLEEVESYLDQHDVETEEVREMQDSITVTRGREDAKKQFRDRFEQLMVDVYGQEHLDSHYKQHIMDEYQIPGGIDQSLDKKLRDNLLVGADKLYHRFRNSMYNSGKSRREG